MVLLNSNQSLLTLGHLYSESKAWNTIKSLSLKLFLNSPIGTMIDSLNRLVQTFRGGNLKGFIYLFLPESKVDNAEILHKYH